MKFHINPNITYIITYFFLLISGTTSATTASKVRGSEASRRSRSPGPVPLGKKARQSSPTPAMNPDAGGQDFGGGSKGIFFFLILKFIVQGVSTR